MAEKVAGTAEVVERVQVERTLRRSRVWPKPTVERPDIETLMAWEEEGGCEATDGCWVEPDGTCPHGYPSWLLVMGLI